MAPDNAVAPPTVGDYSVEEKSTTAPAVVGDGAAEESRMVTLVARDGERFEVPEAAARMSQIITYMIEDGCGGGEIPLPKVEGKVLAKVIQYCNRHAAVPAGAAADNDNAAAKEALESFDAELVDVDTVMLYELIIAANWLDIKGLLDLIVQKVADMIKGKTPEEIRETFGIANDFTKEEEEEIRKENAWAFE